jgi:transcriptional regulator
MYVPAHFSPNDPLILHKAIRQYGFGTLVTLGPDGLEASHVPMLLEAQKGAHGALVGHIARANLQWQRATEGREALAMFLGPHAYITPSWYATKQQHGKVVPTWNYVAVHASGPITFFDDADALKSVVTRLTETYEAGRAESWSIDDAPADFIASMLKGIVGFTLEITKLEGKWKLSQNRSDEDIAGVRLGLQGDGRADIAALMAGSKEG